MSWVGRLFTRQRHPAEPTPPPPASVATVSIPADLAGALTAGGRPLQDAVLDALREHLALATDPTAAVQQTIPFWLAREDQRAGGLDQGLRDTVVGRRGESGP